MKIKKIQILYADKGKQKLFEQMKEYTFGKDTLITTKGSNSKGKTTLIRFIIFALGFYIPLTDGMDSQNYKTKIEFEHNGDNYIFEREDKIISISKNGMKILNETNEYLLSLFSMHSFEDIDNLLGCFYIDQEKGWTLLNRGRIIGKRTFNIEKLISLINKLTDVKNKIKENEKIDLENKKIKVFEEIKILKEKIALQEENKEVDQILKIEAELDRLNNEINNFKYEKKSLESLMNDKKIFIKKLFLYGLKIKIDNRIYIINSDNLTGFEAEEKFIQLEINDLKKEIDILDEKIKYYKKQLENLRKDIKVFELDEIIAKINITKENSERLIVKKEKNSKLKRENNKYIKESLDENVNNIWKILKKILLDLNISQEYLVKDIIYRSKLSGISGTQLHKLTFALKLSLLVYIKEKLKIELPFIIDSPMSGEVNIETANLMLKIARRELGESQIIVSSVYDKYSLNFDKIIVLDKTGVLGNLSNFLYDK